MKNRYKLISMTIGIVFLMLISSNRGGLAYFSPHTLQYSTQSELTFFATGIPFYRSFRGSYEHPLVTMLIEEGYVTPQAKENDRLELIFHWNDSWRDGYGPLYDIFIRDRDEIMDWSLQNRECAQIYWTEGFRLLRSDNPDEIQQGRYLLNNCWGYQDLETMQEVIGLINGEVGK